MHRDLSYTDGALEDYQKAISLGANALTAAGPRLCAADYGRAVRFDRAVHFDPSAAILLRARARGAGDLDHALGDCEPRGR